MLEALKIPKPHIEVQREVVAPLVALDDRIDLLRQTNATLEAIAQALFKSWFIDFDPVRAKAAGREPDGMDATTAAPTMQPEAANAAAAGMRRRNARCIRFALFVVSSFFANVIAPGI